MNTPKTDDGFSEPIPMTPQEAIEKLEEFQNNIVHGSSIFRVIADVIREQAKVKTIHVQGRLTPSQRDTITGAVKWIERIVNRKDELPPLFLDNINPAPLAKELRAMLSENAKAMASPPLTSQDTDHE